MRVLLGTSMNIYVVASCLFSLLTIVFQVQVVADDKSPADMDKIESALDDLYSKNERKNSIDSNSPDTAARNKRQSFENLANQDMDHHWYCNTSITWKDLGVLHYPRFVREVTCITSACMHGFYTCRPQVYEIHVLTVRDENQEEEITVPHSLRQNWRFTEVSVSVGCLCAA